ncbi:MAG: ferredoxin [archaeon]
MVRYQIEFKKSECIGCGACTSQCPENWDLVETSDGFKAKPKKTDINENEYDSNQEAADICPVDCIHIEKIKGKKIVDDFEEEEM